MTYLITGGNGFLGKAICKTLIQNGHNVIQLIRDESDVVIDSKDVEFIYYKTLNDILIFEVLKDRVIDIFLHLAWKGVTSQERQNSFQFTYNIPLVIDSVLLASKLKCNQWIGIGSQAEYGSYEFAISEDNQCNPSTAYGKAKLASCIASLGLSETLRLKAAWIRVFSLFGPGDNPTYFIPYVINSLLKGESPQLTSCSQLWDYLYISDAVSAIISLSQKNISGIFNLGSGHTISLRTVAELINSKIVHNTRINFGVNANNPNGILHLEADITKIHQITGWLPKVDLIDGIHETIEYYSKVKHEGN